MIKRFAFSSLKVPHYASSSLDQYALKKHSYYFVDFLLTIHGLEKSTKAKEKRPEGLMFLSGAVERT